MVLLINSTKLVFAQVRSIQLGWTQHNSAQAIHLSLHPSVLSTSVFGVLFCVKVCVGLGDPPIDSPPWSDLNGVLWWREDWTLRGLPYVCILVLPLIYCLGEFR